MVFRRLIKFRTPYFTRNFCINKPSHTNFENLKILNSKFQNETYSKDHILFNAIGATEELLSFIGLARAYAQESEHEYVDKLKRIQTVIIDINTSISKSNNSNYTSIGSSHINELEAWLDEYTKELPPPEQYIIPGGGIASASLHTARSICRRAERNLVPLVRAGHLHEESSIYLNKLSDFLFTLSRIAAKLDKRTESIYIQKPSDKAEAQ